MRKFAKDSLKLDSAKIVEDSKRWLKVAAVISKMGVYDYPDGVALKSKDELMKATKTARYAKLTINDHPDTLVIMSQTQLFGGVEKPFWDRDRMRAVLAFDKELTPTSFLQKIRLAAGGIGEPMDNSIGFYYRPDFTPGTAPDVNTGKMRRYDYVMRDIMIDHVAAGAFVGRCTAPNCGIGVDTMMRRIALDPFGKYTNMKDCIAKNHDKKNPAGFCAWLHKKITGKYPGQSAQDAVLFSLIGDITKLDQATYSLIFGDAERPSKEWMDACKSKAQSFADDPGAFCGWVFHHGPENLKKSFGTSSVSNKGKIGMSQETETEYAKCVREKKAEGMSDEEAREACKEKKTDQDEESAYDKCIREKKEAGMTQDEAEQACEALKPAAADQEETPWQQCIKEEMAKPDMTMEKAVAACKAKGLGQKKQDQTEEPAEPQETLPTPLEECIATRMEAQSEDEATAKKWCEDELAGLHQPTADIVHNIERLKAKERKLKQRR